MKKLLFKQPLSVIVNFPLPDETKPQCTVSKAKKDEFKYYTSQKDCTLGDKEYATLIGYKSLPNNPTCVGYWILRTYRLGNINLCVEATDDKIGTFNVQNSVDFPRFGL